MKMFGHPKRDFFTSKARPNYEVYGQAGKITPEAGGKYAPFSTQTVKFANLSHIVLTGFFSLLLNFCSLWKTPPKFEKRGGKEAIWDLKAATKKMKMMPVWCQKMNKQWKTRFFKKISCKIKVCWPVINYTTTMKWFYVFISIVSVMVRESQSLPDIIKIGKS